MPREEIREPVRHPAQTVRRTCGSAVNARATTPNLGATSRVRAEASRNGSPAAKGSGFAPACAGRLTNPDSNKKANGYANGSANHAASAEPPTRRPALRVSGTGRASSSVREGISREEALTAGFTAALTPASADMPEAASDDASGTSVAMDAVSPAIPGAAREAYAAAAEGTNGAMSVGANFTSAPGKTTPAEEGKREPRSQAQVDSESSPLPGGEGPLPETPAEFVEQIHREADLIEAWKSLLNSDDEKVRQRAAEKLTEMRYKGAAAMDDERSQIVIDIDSAVARRAAQNRLGGADE